MNDQRDDLFAELGAVWRQDDAPVISDIETRVQRGLWFARLQTWMELSVAAAGTLVGFWLWGQGDSPLGIATVVFSGISLLLVVDFRRREASMLTASVSSQLHGLYRLERSRYLRGRIGLTVCLLALVYTVFLAATSPAPVPGSPKDWVFLVAFVMIAIGVLVTIRQIIRGRIACERLTLLIEAE